jgi:hypothetical protein
MNMHVQPEVTSLAELVSQYESIETYIVGRELPENVMNALVDQQGAVRKAIEKATCRGAADSAAKLRYETVRAACPDSGDPRLLAQLRDIAAGLVAAT